VADEIYRLPDLPYDYGALEPHISGRIMELHHDRHHAGYVKGANTALEMLHEARESDDFDTITQLEKNLAFHLSGHVLHSIFWTNLGPDTGEPGPALSAKLEELFGGVDRFCRHMTQAASTIQGSGWALAAWEPVSRRIVVQQVYDHQGNHGQGTVPLLAIDAWEHAYYLQYKSDKDAFFEAVWNVVDWADVERRLQEAESASIIDLTPQSSRSGV
jgi:Fe-Mn family superoxide dismutase